MTVFLVKLSRVYGMAISFETRSKYLDVRLTTEVQSPDLFVDSVELPEGCLIIASGALRRSCTQLAFSKPI